jgi:hypothetical protein
MSEEKMSFTGSQEFKWVKKTKLDLPLLDRILYAIDHAFVWLEEHWDKLRRKNGP